MVAERNKAWVRVLSAIQTSESMEALILEPLLQSFAHLSEFLSFLSNQANDEKRHSELIQNYLASEFGFVKHKATLSDKIFYTALFPAARVLFRSQGMCGLCVLLFYEFFSVGLYRELKIQAQKDERIDLVKLLTEIMRDEARHIKGVTRLINLCMVNDWEKGKSAHAIAMFLIEIISLDVNFEKYAFHNREIRNSLIVLNIDPEIINNHRKSAIESVRSIIQSRGSESYAC